MRATCALPVRFDEDALLAADDGPDKVPVADMKLDLHNTMFQPGELRLDTGEEGRGHFAASRV
ncbi:MAG TPA: hypothetical protein VMV44_14605 [Rectinemataceae bacterium]|nr:hypothetical protein [Rectinemataceae bacterium]